MPTGPTHPPVRFHLRGQRDRAGGAAQDAARSLLVRWSQGLDIGPSRAMRSKRPTGTAAEVLLRKALWREGLRYRLAPSRLPGQPGIVFRAQRVAVFCDGDFWHGRDWPSLRQRLAQGTNSAGLTSKIAYNIARDQSITNQLRDHGWEVLRFWEADIRADPAAIAARVKRSLRVRSQDAIR